MLISLLALLGDIILIRCIWKILSESDLFHTLNYPNSEALNLIYLQSQKDSSAYATAIP